MLKYGIGSCIIRIRPYAYPFVCRRVHMCLQSSGSRLTVEAMHDVHSKASEMF